MSKILIITSKNDEHADYIINKCIEQKTNESIIRINTEDFMENVIATFDGFSFEVQVKDSGKHFTNRDIKTVWYRRPLPVTTGYFEDEGVSRFVHSQCENFLKGLYYCTHNSALWINLLDADLFAKNKFYQLKTALEVGFKVPSSIITNDANRAVQFATKHSVICNKSLSVPRYTINEIQYPFMTRIVDKKILIENKSTVSLCPTFFQEYIDKQIDIRVVIFNRDIFAFEIHSQDEKMSQVDVRGINPSKIKHVPHELPSSIIQKIRDFMSKHKLVFSSMDLALSKKGEYYFIENNCNGQWLWLEYYTNIALSNCFISLLENG